jgi:hypothetical protein
MLENIKAQFERPRTLTQSKYYTLVRRDHWPKFHLDLFPLAQEYYHELNPYFLFNLYRPDLFKFSKVITVRDGYLNFASFLVDNAKTIKNVTSGPLLIHPDLAPLVPPFISDLFATWQIVQKKQIALKDAKKVIIFGLVSNEYLGDLSKDEFLEKIRLKLEPLKEIPLTTKIELFLPLRKEIFKGHQTEQVNAYLLMGLIKDILPGRTFEFINTQILEEMNFKDHYFFDLGIDKFLVSDNYMHYFMQARGATVNNNSFLSPPKDSLFSFDLSVYHEFHVSPLPQVDSIFSELFFYKKMKNQEKHLEYDIHFQSLVMSFLRT